MTAEPIPHDQTDDDDGPANSVIEGAQRFYVHPKTGERWTSVTSILQSTPKDGLPYWAAQEVARAAMDQLPRMLKAQLTPPCGRGGDDRCRECPECVEHALRLVPEELRDSAGDRGRRVHKAAELYVATGEMPVHDPDIASHLEQYLAWSALMKPTFEMTEATVVNRRHGYAGTLDGIVRFGWLPPKYRELIGQPLVADYKTAKHTYPDNALQLAAYRNAETILLPDGTELPMPPTAGAVLVHIRPDEFDGAELVKPGFFQTHFVEAADEDLEGFLAVAALDRYLHGRGKQAVERAMYKPRNRPLFAIPAPQPTPEPAAAPEQPTAPEEDPIAVFNFDRESNPFAEFPGDDIPF